MGIVEEFPAEPSYIAPPLRIHAVPIDSVNIDPANSRRHDKRNIEVIKASLAKFGQRTPIVVQRAGMIVRKGNGTLTTAREMGWTHIAAIVLDDAEMDATAYSITDNRSSDLSVFDNDLLSPLLQTLYKDENYDHLVTGFDDAEIAQLRSIVADRSVTVKPDADDTPDVQEEFEVSKPGDLFILGEHRLLCGDSRNPEDVARVLKGAKASCIFTDPPYGVSIGAKNRLLDSIQPGGRNKRDIVDDAQTPKQLEARLLPAFENVRCIAMAKDCTVFLTAPQGGDLGMMMMMMMQKAGLPVRHVLIWRKNSATFSMGRLDYDYAHEPILLTWLKKHKRPMSGQFKTSVWDVDRPQKSEEHPTMKPVALYVNAYLNHSDQGDTVYEPYSGSGTAFVAAEETSRKCCGIEIEPCYVDVALHRWSKLTGGDPILERTGEKFSQLVAAAAAAKKG